MRRGAVAAVALGLVAFAAATLVRLGGDAEPVAVDAAGRHRDASVAGATALAPHAAPEHAASGGRVERVVEPPRTPADAEGGAAETSPLHVTGTIRDAYAGALPLARVELRDREDELVASGPCDANGAFDLSIVRTKPLYAWGACAGYQSLKCESWLAMSQLEFQTDFELEPDTVTIHGRLVDAKGGTLTHEQILELFPSVSPETSWRHEPGYSALIACLDGQRGQSGSTFESEIDLDAGTFTIDVPGGFAGEVLAVQRGQVVGRRAWRTGDGPVEIAVDVAAAVARGALRVRVTDAASGRPAPDAQVVLTRAAFVAGLMPDVRKGKAPPPADPAAGVVFADLEPGAWTLNVRAAGSVPVLRPIECRAGEETRVDVELTSGASVRVVVHAPPEMTGEWAWLDYVGATGTLALLEADCKPTADGWTFDLDNLPVGKGALVLDACLLPVDLRAGTNADLDWTIRSAVGFELVARVADPAAAIHARAIDVSFEVATLDGTTLDRFGDHAEVGADGKIRVNGFAPPGKYRVRLEWAADQRAEREIEVAADGANSIEWDAAKTGG